MDKLTEIYNNIVVLKGTSKTNCAEICNHSNNVSAGCDSLDQCQECPVRKVFNAYHQMFDELEAANKQLEADKKAEAEGALVRLPCKTGDIVYAVDSSPVCELAVSHVGLYLDAGEEGDYAPLDDFGHIVFLTPEAAEAALKEREKS